MADKIEYSRLLLKRTNIAGVTPTIPPVSATTLNQFTPTDIFVGEMFANVEDDRFWIRTNTGIVELNTSGGTSGSTGTSGTSGTSGINGTSGVNGTSGTSGVGSGAFLPLSGGTVTGDTAFTEKLYLRNLTSGGSSTYLTVDSDTGQVYTALSSGGSGTSGTSGINGTNGSSGINGTNGSSGINGTSGVNGTSGINGTNGANGTSGVNGTSGTNGANGTSGINGTSGTSGVSGLGLYLPLSGGTVTGDTTFTEKLYLTNLTSGGSSTYLTVDSDTGQVYTAIGGGGSGTSGTSGTSGGGGGGASGGSHFGWELTPGTRYNMGITSDYIEVDYNNFADKVTLYPFTPMRELSISAITMTNTNANLGFNGAGVVMCVYDHDVATNFPKNLILSSSTIDFTSNFTQNNYLVNYTFSAGTTYWLGHAFNSVTNSGGGVTGFGIEWYGLLTFAAPTNPGSGDEPFKMAINSSYTFPNLPDPFTGSRYTGTLNPPEICIIPSA